MIQGNTTKQAEELIAKYGKNELKDTEKVNIVKQFLKQFLNPLIIVLLIVAAITFALHEYTDSLVIFFVVFFNTLIGFFQERKAQHAVDSLKDMMSPKSKVYRDGVLKQIDAADITIDDVVVLEAGDRVPADGDLIEYKNLQINESQLTGESFPVIKNEADKNVFMSTIVTSGRGVFKVNRIGMETEIGKITRLVSKKSKDTTPLEKKIHHLTRKIIYLVGVSCLLVFFLGMFKGHDIETIFRTSVSLGVSAIPEGLPVVVTLTLAIGVYRMSKRNSIIRNLPSASTLAGVDVICTDKTGTITEGKIELVDILTYKSNKLLRNETDEHILKLSILCNDAEYNTDSETGDLLDIAILKYASDNNLSIKELRESYKRLDDIPFDSEYKYQATLNSFNDISNILTVKGAFDILIDRCVFKDSKYKDNVLSEVQELGIKGYRVILLGSKLTHQEKVTHDDINDLELKGIFVFVDPLRADIDDAVAKCHQSGIQTIMITGDHISTAKNIAEKAGIMTPNGIEIDGESLRSLDKKILNKRIKNIDVVARANPDDKVKIIDSLRHNKKIVAMTGDGVNDAPALVKSDIGIAMGQNGTDAARESADMVLVDNRFSTIVEGIEEARVVFENLKKVITYIFSTSFGEILIIFLSILLGMPLPLLAAQILWLNLITDGFLTTAIAMDTKNEDLMKYKPSRYKTEIIDKVMVMRIIFLAGIMAVGSMLFFQTQLRNNSVEYARTSLLLVMAMYQWFNAFNVRSESESIFKVGFTSNIYIIYTLIFEIALTALAIYNPFLQSLLKTVPVGIDVWFMAIGITLTIIVFEEIRKAYFKSLGFDYANSSFLKLSSK